MPINDHAESNEPKRAPLVVSVSNVNNVIASLLKSDVRLNNISVRGEISQFTKNAKSGHYYFSLKDASSVLNCVMFSFMAQYLKFQPKVGMTVICKGSIEAYTPNGSYSLKCSAITPDGEGEQAVALQELKNRLEAEGLFAQKRTIPTQPKKIAVITSGSGAAFKDIQDVLTDRYPLVKLVLVPTQVQGDTAPRQIANAIKRAATIGADTLIIGRGGGATETLEAFNTEIVVRAIYNSPIPTISAVGHGINISLADFAADKYAPTPSAAACDASPDINMYKAALNDTLRRLSRNMKDRFIQLDKQVDAKSELIRALSPNVKLDNMQQRVDSLQRSISSGLANRLNSNEKSIKAIQQSLSTNINNRLSSAEKSINASAEIISALNPLAILSRGYSATESKGRIISSVEDLSSGDELKIRLSDGIVTAQVTSIERNNDTNGI